MRSAMLAFALLTGCTVLTSPGDYEGGNRDGSVTRCDGDEDCSPDFCDTDRGECVECRTAADCPGGAECEGGACAAETCGGEVCSDPTPVCLMSGSIEACVECVAATDCPPGESCDDENRCQSCSPATECATDEACVIDPGGDYCVDCDADDDGEIRRDPECAGVAGDRDCDDDGDGFCLGIDECAGECDEIAIDCDDTDPSVRPVIATCTDPEITACSDPGDLLPGSGAASVSVMALGALPEPRAADVRTPMSLVAESAAGFFDVVHLEGEGTEGYSDRFRRLVDIEARDLRALPLPPTELVQFIDLRAKVDLEGTVVGALGWDEDSEKSLEVVLAESFEGAVIGSRVGYRDPTAVAPIDVSIELLADPLPYIVWCSDQGDSYGIRAGSGSAGTLFSEEGAVSPAGPLMVHTARGLVSIGVREEPDLLYWDERAAFESTESRDPGGGAALAAAETTLGFDARVSGGEIVVRSITFTEGGFVANDPTTFGEGDGTSRVAVSTYNNIGFIVFDGPTDDGARRLFISRAGQAAGATAATTPRELTGAAAPDFSVIYGLEVAARTSAGSVELAVLVHGTPVGTSEPGLYLFIARRCPS